MRACVSQRLCTRVHSAPKNTSESNVVGGMEVAISGGAMRLTTLACLSMLSLFSLPAAADEPVADCPPGAFCEELASSAEPEVEEAPEEEVEAPLPSPEAVSDERSASPCLDSELADWNAGPPPADAPSYGDPVMHAGIGIFGASYTVPFLTGLVAALIAEDNPDAAPLIPLMLPVAGPLITGAIYEASPGVWGLLGATSGVQALGLLILAVGASMDSDAMATSVVRPTADGLLVRF